MNQLETLSDALCELLKQIEGTDIKLIIELRQESPFFG